MSAVRTDSESDKSVDGEKPEYHSRCVNTPSKKISVMLQACRYTEFKILEYHSVFVDTPNSKYQSTILGL